jgi:hypothetical protein
MAAGVARLAIRLRNQEVTGVAVLDLDDIAEVTEVNNLFEQNDLHVSSPRLLVVVGVRQQGQEAGALDGGAQLALIAGLGAGQTSRHDLGVFLDEFLQDIHILVVDLFDLFCREAAELAALEQRPPPRFFFLSSSFFLKNRAIFVSFQKFECIHMQHGCFAVATLGSEKSGHFDFPTEGAACSQRAVSPKATTAISISTRRSAPLSVCVELCCSLPSLTGTPAGV